MEEAPDQAIMARRLMRRQSHAALATRLDDSADAHPYASLVAVAFDLDASPLLLLSGLAQHTRNIARDGRVSLLFGDWGAGCTANEVGDPLAMPRLSLLGTAARIDDPRLLARFVARHPNAAAYAGFGDFRLYRVAIGRGHLIAGFGRISWIDGERLRFGAEVETLAAAEAGVVAHMNADQADAIARYARRLLGRSGDGWRMTGIDPEGVDLRRGDEVARLDFADHSLGSVLDPVAARQALVHLAKAAGRRSARLAR